MTTLRRVGVEFVHGIRPADGGGFEVIVAPATESLEAPGALVLEEYPTLAEARAGELDLARRLAAGAFDHALLFYLVLETASARSAD